MHKYIFRATESSHYLLKAKWPLFFVIWVKRKCKYERCIEKVILNVRWLKPTSLDFVIRKWKEIHDANTDLRSINDKLFSFHALFQFRIFLELKAKLNILFVVHYSASFFHKDFWMHFCHVWDYFSALFLLILYCINSPPLKKDGQKDLASTASIGCDVTHSLTSTYYKTLSTCLLNFTSLPPTRRT